MSRESRDRPVRGTMLKFTTVHHSQFTTVSPGPSSSTAPHSHPALAPTGHNTRFNGLRKSPTKLCDVGITRKLSDVRWHPQTPQKINATLLTRRSSSRGGVGMRRLLLLLPLWGSDALEKRRDGLRRFPPAVDHSSFNATPALAPADCNAIGAVACTRLPRNVMAGTLHSAYGT